MQPQANPSRIAGPEIAGTDVRVSNKWIVFAPCDAAEPPLDGKELAEIPSTMVADGKQLEPVATSPQKCQLDFQPFFGPPSPVANAAYVFVEIDSSQAQEATIGLGADYYLKAWMNGEVIFDKLLEGCGHSPCSIDDHKCTVHVRSGRNILALCLINGTGPAVLAVGGPDDLRRGDFASIVPPAKKVVDKESLYELYPPDPEAVVTWEVPENFNPTLPDLGFPHLEAAEHEVIFHALRCNAALDDGGDGEYESSRHGTWNHNQQVLRFGDHLVVNWQSHARDEHGPGARILARCGRVVDDEGRVDWGTGEEIVEAAPPAVKVDRRVTHGTVNIIRNINSVGSFHVVEGRLLFIGRLSALYGRLVSESSRWSGGPLKPGNLPSGLTFHDVLGPRGQGGTNAKWHLGLKFVQEWAVVDNGLKPVSPLFLSAEMPTSIALTPEITRPVAAASDQFRSALRIEQAPADIQEILQSWSEVRPASRNSGSEPTTHALTHDGTNGLAHSTQYQRPDGAWVTIRENQRPRVQPVYYAAERPSLDDFYPPARRTNLYGAANPAAGTLPDGRIFLVGNSPNRRTMFLTTSKDGRHFDQTWFLLHRQLSDFTPGAMKAQGGPGAGPQYFVPLVVNQSLWIVYSISKEHIGATRVPLALIDW